MSGKTQSGKTQMSGRLIAAVRALTGGEIGEEVHDDRDQFFRVEKGEVVIDGKRSTIKGDDGSSYRQVPATTS